MLNASPWDNAMPANIILCVLNFAFPDVCKVPIPFGFIPTPFPNIALSSTHIPALFNIIFGGGLVENILVTGTVSNGNQGGVLMGLISNLIVGPDRQILGSIKIFMGVCLATRMCTLTTQNGMPPNAVGASLVPSQFRVLYAS